MKPARERQLLKVIKDLIEAVRTGECPDRTCERCKEKWDAVARAKAVLEEAR